MDPNVKMRVKVYKLSAGNQWIDQGTGHCSCEFNADKSEGTLIVRSEDDEDVVLLSSRIRVGEDLYQRQQETLIVWSENEGVDLALSFQEAEGCGEIWDNINEVQQHYAEDLFSDPSDANGAGGAEYLSLPDPDISNLDEIEIMVRGALIGMNEKEKLAGFIIMDNYIDKLLPVLDTCEDLESIADLHHLHGIITGIIMLNDIAVIQHILKDEIIIGCLGMLEYDPELGNEKEDYRDFISKRSKFKQIVPINDPEVEQKIHQAYRLQYLRDTVLVRIMDEGLSSILSSLIFFHNIDIVNYIHQDRGFLKQLFGILEDEAESMERKRDVIRFVQQFCTIAKTTQMPARVGLYRTLSQTGLFNVFELALSDSEPSIRMAGTEIFLSAMEHDPNLVRSYIVKQSEEQTPKQLMNIILYQFLIEQDMGIKLQYSEVIRMLLDTNTSQCENGMPAALDAIPHLDPDADKFLDLFYASHISKFVSPLLELSNDMTTLERSLASVCENACQILSFMVRNHSFRSKYYVLSSGIVDKISLLLRNRDQHLRLSALRFFRTCIGLNDEFYHRYLIKHNVVQHIVDALLSTGNKNNLLNSACIEFFDFIRSENIKSLLTHTVSLHGEKLKHIEYVQTFKALIRKYEQQQDTSIADAEAAEAAASESGSTKRGGPGKGADAWASSTVDDDEEAYFNNSDEEDAVPDEGKREDDPPTSDLRRRVKEDDESNRGEASSQGFMDTEPGPILASQASLAPPTLLRRKLVDYGEDDDGDDEDGDAFGRLANTKPKTGPSSEPSPPPEKKIRLESGEDSSDDGGTMSDSSDRQRSPGSKSPQKASSPSNDGAGQPIKFKLNSLRNGRASSPLSTSNVKSRSVSSLPPVATRTGIAFVKASTVDGENQTQTRTSEDSSMTEAAIQLKSEMARDYKRLDPDMENTSKRAGDAASSHDSVISMQGAIVIPVSPPEEESQVRSTSEDPPTPSAVLSE
ncbi:protein phosphatase 4 regulatory subunit 3 [Entomortierella parvispora]|uniref:Protein phosphatase 4 regulatory subunit 3 n=1 Tax=Entomortierella parvispora TaxID=205924 RepID=A0A9P3LUG2_9FUNG|nr:protein phosphatase 4 regulatory subunit 3 [Entomortierella parvispora]